jgi:hypothetical protein
MDAGTKWLLEIGETHPPQYITEVFEDGTFESSGDIEKALKFETEKEARNAWWELEFKPYIHICEHEWVDGPEVEKICNNCRFQSDCFLEFDPDVECSEFEEAT